MSDLLATLAAPGPTIIALTQPFWSAAASGRLVIQFCEDCTKHVFYPRAICPHCWSVSLVWRDASGFGRLKTFSEVHKPGHPAWLPAAPYTVGLVELAEGPTMTSFILRGKDDGLTIGDQLILTPTRIGGRMLPAFRKSGTRPVQQED